MPRHLKGVCVLTRSKNAASPAAHNGEKGEVLQGELLEALLEGMGLSEMQPVPQFDRENMRQRWGKFWACSLRAPWRCSSRSILKRGVKADMTMVLDDANNPFKLLPTRENRSDPDVRYANAGLYAADKIRA